MKIALDDSLVTYSLKYATMVGDPEITNYICNRISESVAGMSRAITQYCIDDLDKYLREASPDYLKSSPLRRLLEVLELHIKEYK